LAVRRIAVGESVIPAALTSPRTAAIGAAVALHALFIVVSAGASGEARVPVRAMTVRSIVMSVAEPAPLPTAETPVAERPAPAGRAVAKPERAPGLPPVHTVRETPAPGAPVGFAPSESMPPLPASRPPISETQSLSSAPAQPQHAVAALPAALDYLGGARLDPGPQPIGDIEPEYPDSGFMREGTVVLRVLIDEAGHVDNVAVVRATPRGAFEDAAIEAFGKALFSPGRAAGVPVKSQITVEVHFAPINRGARISGRGY